MIDRIRQVTFTHPRVKGVVREGWGAVRQGARLAGMSPPFDPVELAQTRSIQRDGGAQGEPRVLFLSMRGWSTHLMWETTFARAVRQRGGTPIFASCGGRLPICDAANAHSAPPMPCHSCREYAVSAISGAGFDPILLSDLVDVAEERRAAARRTPEGTVAEYMEFKQDGVAYGDLVRVSTLWFLARGTLPDTLRIRRTYRDFLIGAQVVCAAFRELLKRTNPGTVFMLNGTFFMERLMYEMAKQRDIRCVTYERGYMTDTIALTDEGFACDYPVTASDWDRARVSPLTAEEARQLDEYLLGRPRDQAAIDKLWKGPVEDLAEIFRQLNLDGTRPMVALFSNIAWDSAVQGKGAAFDSLADWVVATIAGFAQRPGVDLVVRLHPAEVMVQNHRTLEPMMEVIRSRFGALPANVHVIQPQSNLSSYTIMGACDLGLVYTSTVGLEMALRAKPVVVSAKAHYWRRGFTWDADTREQYWATIDELLASAPPPDELDHRRETARRYAYEYFFRLMKKVDLVHEVGRARPRLTYGSERELRRGENRGLDEVIAMILGETKLAGAPSSAR